MVAYSGSGIASRALASPSGALARYPEVPRRRVHLNIEASSKALGCSYVPCRVALRPHTITVKLGGPSWAAHAQHTWRPSAPVNASSHLLTCGAARGRVGPLAIAQLGDRGLADKHREHRSGAEVGERCVGEAPGACAHRSLARSGSLIARQSLDPQVVKHWMPGLVARRERARGSGRPPSARWRRMYISATRAG